MSRTQNVKNKLDFHLLVPGVYWKFTHTLEILQLSALGFLKYV